MKNSMKTAAAAALNRLSLAFLIMKSISAQASINSNSDSPDGISVEYVKRSESWGYFKLCSPNICSW